MVLNFHYVEIMLKFHNIRGVVSANVALQDTFLAPILCFYLGIRAQLFAAFA